MYWSSSNLTMPYVLKKRKMMTTISAFLTDLAWAQDESREETKNDECCKEPLEGETRPVQSERKETSCSEPRREGICRQNRRRDKFLACLTRSGREETHVPLPGREKMHGPVAEEKTTHGPVTGEEGTHLSEPGTEETNGPFLGQKEIHGKVPHEETTYGPMCPKETRDGTMSPEERTDGPMPPEETSDGPMSLEETTDGPVPREETGDGPVPWEETADSPVPCEETADGPVPREETADGPVPQEETTNGPAPREETSDGPVPREETTDGRPPLKEITDCPVPREETAYGPVLQEETADGQVSREETADGPVPLEETTDSPVPQEETTNGPVPREERTDGPVPREETTDGPPPREEITDCPVPREETADGPVPREETKDGLMTRKETKDGPVPWEERTDGPLPAEETTDGPVPREETSDGPVPREETADCPLPREETTDGPVPREETTDGPVPLEEITDCPVPREETTDGPLPWDKTADGPVPWEETAGGPVPQEETTGGPMSPEETTDGPLPGEGEQNVSEACREETHGLLPEEEEIPGPVPQHSEPGREETLSPLPARGETLEDTFLATIYIQDTDYEEDSEDKDQEYVRDLDTYYLNDENEEYENLEYEEDSDIDCIEETDNEEDSEPLLSGLKSKQMYDGNRSSIKEKNLIRDVNLPGIYIRKLRRSSKASRAQMNRKKIGNFRVYDNYHACLCCGELRQHIKTHMNVHRKNPELRVMLQEHPDFEKLRKLGDHKHNQKVVEVGLGEIILSRRPSSVLDISQYGPCLNCKDWMLLKNLKRHLESCSKKKVTLTRRQVIIFSQVEAGFISNKASKLMVSEVFTTMRLDEVGSLAKSDETIIALGESWLRRTMDNIDKRRYYTSQHMRLMAKLLIELRRLDPLQESGESSQHNMAYYLKPKFFDQIVGAALECCFPFMDDIEDLAAPSNGLKIKYDLRRMVTARWALLVKVDSHSLEAKEMQTLLELISVEWGERITKLSRSVLARRQFTIVKELPAPEDIQKMTCYVASQLKCIEPNTENYARIAQLTQTRLLMFNKRRSGEIDSIRLNSYAGKTRSLDEMDQSLVGDLTEVEKKLLQSHDLMIVRGKFGRRVPVLIPEDARGPLDYIASGDARRDAGIADDNRYLFPNSLSGSLRSYESMKKICCELTLHAPSRITSVSMRKYSATLAQVLNMDKYQLEWLCQHLGHSGDVHKVHYRQMSGFIERIQMAKLFLVQDMNLSGKFKGKKLEDINIQDIVFPEAVESAEAAEVDDATVDTIVGDMPQTERDEEAADEVVFEDRDSEESEKEEEELFDEPQTKGKKTNKPKVQRQKWDDVENDEIRKYFKGFLDARIAPRTKDVEIAKKKSKQKGGKIWMRTNDKIIKKVSAINHRK